MLPTFHYCIVLAKTKKIKYSLDSIEFTNNEVVMNRNNVKCYAKYRTVFTKKNDAGSYCWIRLKQIKKNKLRRERSIIEEYFRKSTKLYHELKKESHESGSAKERFLAETVRQKRLSIKILFWMLAKYSKYTSQFDSFSISEGVILNKEVIQSALDTLPRIKASLPVKRIFVKFAIILLLLPPFIVVFMTIFVLAFYPNLFKEIITTSNTYYSPGNLPVIARWESPSGHQFTNAVYHREFIRLKTSFGTTVASSIMVAKALLGFFEIALLVVYSILSYRSNVDGYSTEEDSMSIYKMIMEKLENAEKPLDSASKKILKKRGISSQELLGYRIYSNKALTNDRIADLFKEVRAKVAEKDFYKAVATELGSSSDEESI